jgi:hypothetical protein
MGNEGLSRNRCAVAMGVSECEPKGEGRRRYGMERGGWGKVFAMPVGGYHHVIFVCAHKRTSVMVGSEKQRELS